MTKVGAGWAAWVAMTWLLAACYDTPSVAIELPALELSAAEEAEVESLVLPIPENWAGDFAGMRERRLVRLLVPYSKTFYTVDRGQQHGISYELGKALEVWLNRKHPYSRKSLRWRVMFIPVARSELMPKLRAGVGDIAIGGLTITEERLQSVDFTEPLASNISEVLVTGPNSPSVTTLDELSGKEVTVRTSSSHYQHLVRLSQDFRARGLAPIEMLPADENLEPEDLLQMVNAGLLKAMVVDRYIANIWKPLYSQLTIHDEVAIHQGAEFAWAIRQNSPGLKAELARFVRAHKTGTKFGNSLRNKYLQNGQQIINATSAAELKKFNTLVQLFEKHAATYEFDYLILMAQGFQESQFNQAARSPRGALGIMQVMPATAADPAIGIRGIGKSADKNIEAGSKYLRLLADHYLNDPQLTSLNRMLMSFAAYNAGPGNLRKFRRLTEKSGLDKNIWFGNVEHGASRIVGRETVDYVGNIYKYYVAYKLAANKSRQRAELIDGQ